MPKDLYSSLDALTVGEGNGRVQIWPGIDNIPHRGFIRPDLKEKESRNLPLGAQLYVRQYDMSDERQNADYQRTMSRIFTHQIAGRMKITHLSRNWDKSKKSMIIYVEWVEYFTYTKKEASEM